MFVPAATAWRTASEPEWKKVPSPRFWKMCGVSVKGAIPTHCTPSPPMRSEERRVGKGVDLGGRRIIKKKKKRNEMRWSAMVKEQQCVSDSSKRQKNY